MIKQTPHMEPFLSKRRLYNFEPLKPHFYIVKLRFTGVYIIFRISSHRLWVLVRTASLRRFYRVLTIHFLSRNLKNIRIFYQNIFIFLGIKFSEYFFVMRHTKNKSHNNAFRQMRAASTHISLRIRVPWAGHSLSAYSDCRIYHRTARNTRM